MHVEVDETFTRRRKYERVRLTADHAIVIFGAYCRETKQCMYWKVENKSRSVPWAYMGVLHRARLYYRHRLRATIQRCSCLGFAEYLTVNARGQGRFVNPSNSGARTQNIEGHNRYVNLRPIFTYRQGHPSVYLRIYISKWCPVHLLHTRETVQAIHRRY